MGSRAQTETLGFVLVFAIITASIGLVYASGFTGLNDAREVEQVNNAERAFEVFADNIDDIVHWNAPSRSTEIRLSDATLTIGEPVNIRLNDSGGGGFDASLSIRPIIYDAGTGERIIYVQGAIIRESGNDATVLRESSMLVTENRTVIPIIQTREGGTGSVGGSTTVLIRANHAVSSQIYGDDNLTSPVWFNVTSPRADIWVEHMESNHDVECLLEDNTAACQIMSNRIHITRVQIAVQIE